jgi:hypothetical protein
MKKLMIALYLVFLISLSAGVAVGEIWHENQTIALAWNAFDPIEQGDTIGYYVYVKDLKSGDLVGNIDTRHGKAMLDISSGVEASVTLPHEGRFYFGVSTYRIPDGETIRIETVSINWSNEDIPPGATPNPFGSAYFVVPSVPMNFMIKP